MGVTLSPEAQRPIATLDKAMQLVHIVYSSDVPLLRNIVTKPLSAAMQEGRKALGGGLHLVREALEVVKGVHYLVVALLCNSSTISPAALHVHFL
jgi:hypothetical protein